MVRGLAALLAWLLVVHRSCNQPRPSHNYLLGLVKDLVVGPLMMVIDRSKPTQFSFQYVLYTVKLVWNKHRW